MSKIFSLDSSDIREFIFYVFLLPFVFWLVYKLHKCYKMKNHK